MSSYNRNRYYSPALGRFISQDPIGLAGGQIDVMFADTATARGLLQAGKLKALGYAPRISLDEGLSRTVRWYTQHEKRNVK